MYMRLYFNILQYFFICVCMGRGRGGEVSFLWLHAADQNEVRMQISSSNL